MIILAVAHSDAAEEAKVTSSIENSPYQCVQDIVKQT
jgi:hypothetical protein